MLLMRKEADGKERRQDTDSVCLSVALSVVFCYGLLDGVLSIAHQNPLKGSLWKKSSSASTLLLPAPPYAE